MTWNSKPRQFARQSLVLALGMFIAGGAFANGIGNLDNLECKRSMAIAILLDPDLGADERGTRMRNLCERLVDFERIVLADISLCKSRK